MRATPSDVRDALENLGFRSTSTDRMVALTRSSIFEGESFAYVAMSGHRPGDTALEIGIYHPGWEGQDDLKPSFRILSEIMPADLLREVLENQFGMIRSQLIYPYGE